MNTYSSWSYIQILSVNIKEIVKIKNSFLNLLTRKIEEVQKVINKPKKDKPRFNMIIKDFLR